MKKNAREPVIILKVAVPIMIILKVAVPIMETSIPEESKRSGYPDVSGYDN